MALPGACARAVHAAGTVVGLGLFAAGLVFGPLWLVPAGVVVGYAAAWLSHLLIERNRPATFTYPLSLPLRDKIEAIATRVYGAGAVEFSEGAAASLAALTDLVPA
jgi:hypothetical protein